MLWKYNSSDLVKLCEFKSLKALRPIINVYQNRFLILIFPNQNSNYIDLNDSNPKVHHFPTLNVICGNTNLNLCEFKSIIASDGKMFCFMTSKRPDVDDKGR